MSYSSTQTFLFPPTIPSFSSALVQRDEVIDIFSNGAAELMCVNQVVYE